MQLPPTKIKILATVGPASSSEKTIRELIKEGASAFRLNFSHGSHEDHQKRIAIIRKVSGHLKSPVSILADLQGPKIRTGLTPDNRKIQLVKGRTVVLTPTNAMCSETLISVSYSRLLSDVQIGQQILLNDGAVRLQVEKIDRRAAGLTCRILNNGAFSSHKGVNFPNADLSVPALTSKDRRDLDFILRNDIDYIALSFVRRPQDLTVLNRLVARAQHRPKIIAKIEKPEALVHIDGILDICDGIMVARGDLGVETSIERVPILQKQFIAQAGLKGKLVIVATQMLESMITQPLPTRAEAADVANAVLDGADAVMLSAETAAGDYPVASVQTMASIARTAEQSPFFNDDFIDLDLRDHYAPHAICEAAEWASRDMGGIPVVVFTVSGSTARYLSKIRTQAPIYALTPDPRVADSLALCWNVRAFTLPMQKSMVVMYRKAEQLLAGRGLLAHGDRIVVISGGISVSGATNMIRIKSVGEK